MAANLQIELSDIVFTNPGVYFLKLELENLSSNETEIVGLRTEVYSEETTTPAFKQSSFQVHYDTPKNSKLKISALSIERDSLGKPQVISTGSIEMSLYKVIQTVEKESVHSVKSKFTKGGINVGEITTRFQHIESRAESVMSSFSSVVSGNIGRILLNRSMINSEVESEEDEPEPVPVVESNTPELKEESKAKQKIISHETKEIPILETPIGLQTSDNSVNSFKDKSRKACFIVQQAHSLGQTLLIQVHDLWDLPCIRNATTGTAILPTAFITAKTDKDVKDKKKAKAATHVHIPAREASFGEHLFLDYDEPYVQSNIPSVNLTIADNITKRIIAKFNIPIQSTFFPSHRQLTLILRAVSPAPEMSSPHARISITNIDTSVSSPYLLQREYQDKMVFMEFLLRGLSCKNSNMPFDSRMIAVLRVVDDGSEYVSEKKRLLKRHQQGFSSLIPPLAPQVMLDFDNGGNITDQDAFSRQVYIDGLVYNRHRKPRAKANVSEYYQMTVASGKLDRHHLSEGKKSGVPEWNQHFVFAHEMVTFTPETSLVIEYYREPSVLVSADPFRPEEYSVDFDEPSKGRPVDDMLAYSIIPLGDFTVLPKTESGKVVPVNNLKVNFVGNYEQLPGTGAIFCKIDIRVPDNWHLIRPTTPSNGYTKRKTSIEKTSIPRVDEIARKITQTQDSEFPMRIRDRKKQDPLPDMSFESLIEVVKNEREQEKSDRKKRIEEMELANDPTRMIFTFKDIQQRQKLIDRLMQELEARTEAVKKIGSDLYASRQENAIQEAEMKTMKKKIQENDIRTVKLLNTIDIDVLGIDEIKRRYALLAQKLQIEINRGRDLTDKLDIAQKIKIERNELEKKYLELRHAHKAQSTHIQTLQDKLGETKKFKDAIRKQEMVIQKLEVLLKDSMSGAEGQGRMEEFFRGAKVNPECFDGGVYRLLTEENGMLKDKLLKLERLTAPESRPKDYTAEYEIQQLSEKLDKERERSHQLEQSKLSGGRNEELLKMLMRAERAEVRVKSLETESAKRYATQILEAKSRDKDNSRASSRKSTPTNRNPASFLNPLF